MRIHRFAAPVAPGLLFIILAACSSSPPTGGAAIPAVSAPHAAGAPAALPKEPIVVTYDTANDSLAYWPMQRGGSQSQPTALSAPLGLGNVYALAADGDVMVIANYNPAELVTYDLKTKAEHMMSDPYGGPVDVAVGKDGSYYALNLTNVVVFKPGSSQPSELICSKINLGESIAVDNEGDVFVDGYGPASFMGVVEYPAGSTKCNVLHIRKQHGYTGGIGVDPKTDDLIVVDDPSLCAGGLEGLMLIYPKPYEERNAVRRVLGATYCAANFRLDAGSKHILYGDASVSAGVPIIDQSRYPSARSEGQYWEGYFASGAFSGFTTIPNTLPN